MNILLNGCSGKMGQVITRLLMQDIETKIICGVDRNVSNKNNYPVYRNLSDVKEDADVLIDFSNHSCIKDVINFGYKRSIPLVICTTGFSDDEKKYIRDASNILPIINSANMSIGINLMLSLVKQAAAALYEGYDIEIIEKHHNLKADAPSGTAIAIADTINSTLNDRMEYKFGRHSTTDKRSKNEIGIHSIRGGAIVGEHEVIFAGLGEVIEIKHSALSKDVFGIGAIKAAKFIINQKPGLYSMKDVIS